MSDWRAWIPVALGVLQVVLIPFCLAILDSRIAAALLAHNRDVTAHPVLSAITTLNSDITTLNRSVIDLRLAMERQTARSEHDRRDAHQ